jgi:hypothetical protein
MGNALGKSLLLYMIKMADQYNSMSYFTGKYPSKYNTTRILSSASTGENMMERVNVLRLFSIISMILLLGSLGLASVNSEEIASGTAPDNFEETPSRIMGNRSVGTSYDLLARDDDWIDSDNNIVNKNGEFYTLEGGRPNLRSKIGSSFRSNYLGMNSRNIQEYEGNLYVGYLVINTQYPSWTSFKLQVSTDGGDTWENSIEVHNATNANYGSVEILVYQDKIFYLYSSNNENRLYLKVASYKNWMDLEEQDPLTVDTFTTTHTTMIGHQDDVFIFYKSSSYSYPEFRAYSSGTLQSNYYINNPAYLMCPVSIVKTGVPMICLLYMDNMGMLKSCLSMNSGQTWGDIKNVLNTTYSIQSFSAACIDDTIHIVMSSQTDNYLRYAKYKDTTSVSPVAFALLTDNGMDYLDREACISGVNDEIWIAAETGSGHVSVFVSYDDGDNFKETITMGDGSAHCPILDRSLRAMSVINGSNMDIFTLDTLNSGSITSKVMSPMGLNSWIDFGFSYSGGAPPGYVAFRIMKADGIEQLFPESGYLTLSDLDQGRINGIYYNHFGEFTGQWASGSGLVDGIRLDIRIMLGDEKEFELYSISINYSVSFPWKGDLRSTEQVVIGSEQFTTTEDGMRLDPIHRISEPVIGPLTFDDEMPAHLSVWFSQVNNGVSIRCEILNGALEPISGFSRSDSIVVTESQKEIYLRWGERQLGNLHASAQPLYFRFVINNPDQTGMTMKWIRLSYTSPPDFIRASSGTDSVYRGRGVDIFVEAEDQEDIPSNLHVELEYLDPITKTWENGSISSGVWDGNHRFHFSTFTDMNIGEYMFRGTITDGIGSRIFIEDLGITINVLNNPPNPPEMILEQGVLFCGDEVQLTPYKSSIDLETKQEDITYNLTINQNGAVFRQVDGLLEPGYILEEGIIKKHETWNFTICAWDGIDLSIPANVGVTVLNSPPDVANFPASLDILEDDTLRLDLSSWIVDEDMDEYSVEFSTSPYLSMIRSEDGTYIKPMDNWKGMTYLMIDILDGEEDEFVNICVNCGSQERSSDLQ